MQNTETSNLIIDIVVCGWHFQSDLIYAQILKEASQYDNYNIRLFIASHKIKEQIDKILLKQLEEMGWQLLFFDNIGWDWGSYQQFLKWQKDNGHLGDYYLFMHDDLEIKKQGFISEFINEIKDGVQVVGNSVPIQKNIEIKKDYPEDILLAKVNGFDVNVDHCGVVRGSCFFITKEIAENILLKMPIKAGNDIFLANSSLRIFGGLVSDKCGLGVFSYLGDEPRKSQYINESLRGEGGIFTKQGIKSFLYPYINRDRLRRILRFTKAPKIELGSGLRLNLGSGNQILKNYFNIDIAAEFADQKADILEIDFEDDTIAEVQMIHVIEHLDYVKVYPFIEKIHTWLKPGGRLVLEFPDLIKCCRFILKNKNNAEEIRYSPCATLGLYGNPRASVYNFHKWGWAKTTMVPLLKKIGFKKIYIERVYFHMARRDIRIVAMK